MTPREPRDSDMRALYLTGAVLLTLVWLLARSFAPAGGLTRSYYYPLPRDANPRARDRPWRSSGRVTMVAVVQAAHVRHRNDLARCSRLDASAHGRILAQREMRAPEMVVVDVRSQYSVE